MDYHYEFQYLIQYIIIVVHDSYNPLTILNTNSAKLHAILNVSVKKNVQCIIPLV